MTKILFFVTICLLCTLDIYAGEENLYDFKWLEDGESVFVLQNKEYPKAGRFGIDLHYLKVSDVSYTDVSGLGAQAAFYFSEEFGIDFTYKSYSNSDNADLQSLVGDLNTKALINRVESSMFFHLDYIPFYGKINTFNRIFYFDWGFGIGVGKLNILSNKDTFTLTNEFLTFKSESTSGYDFRSFFKLYLTETYNFGLEYNLIYYSAEIDAAGTKDTVSYNDIVISFGFLF